MSDVEQIISDVRLRGDAALHEWSQRFDGAPFARAVADANSLPAAALLDAADAIRRWHELQRPADIRLEVRPGVELERRWVPLQSVGLYIPRGLVSTLLMTAIPAQIAGVRRIVVCTPPRGSELIAAAAALFGIEIVWALGGAQAIAALAYGTESIARVDKIVGPGGGAVNEAKLVVSRDVAIDLPAGPSEVAVVTGRNADTRLVELELAAQQEHGADSVCTVIAADGDESALVDAIDARAAEHVALLGDDVEMLASRISNAGSIFVGRNAPVPAGDYATGANHVLPTGGWARSVGGLGLESFLKPVTVQRISADGLTAIRPTVEALATIEGMTAHAAAVRR